MDVTTSKVFFFFQDVKLTLKDRTRLKKFIESIFKKERKPLNSINYIFCTDEALFEINKQFLKHYYYTDIITFDLSGDDGTEAEVYISVDRVKDNAATLGDSFAFELHRVIFHGALHLCGYGDKSKLEALKMRSLEDKYLTQYFQL